MSNRFDLATGDAEGLRQAAQILRKGGLVAVPTETVYGLAADATRLDAVAKIYAAKGRPDFNPLIIHVDGLGMAQRYGRFDALTLELAEAFWPGPLTLVVPLADDAGLAPSVTAGLDTVAIRHAPGAMAALASLCEVPLAAPSANTSGKTSPTNADHVAHDLGAHVDLILDGGACTVGLESTIVRARADGAITVLRRGGISEEALSRFGPVSVADQAKGNDAPQSPGQLLAHYAPSVSLKMNVYQPEAGEGWIAFGADYAENLAAGGASVQLSAQGDLEEAARRLYGAILQLDQAGVPSIAVAPIPDTGIGQAINDRLRRAATGSKKSETS